MPNLESLVWDCALASAGESVQELKVVADSIIRWFVFVRIDNDGAWSTTAWPIQLPSEGWFAAHLHTRDLQRGVSVEIMIDCAGREISAVVAADPRVILDSRYFIANSLTLFRNTSAEPKFGLLQRALKRLERGVKSTLAPAMVTANRDHCRLVVWRECSFTEAVAMVAQYLRALRRPARLHVMHQ
jgi:hypothetical protein